MIAPSLSSMCSWVYSLDGRPGPIPKTSILTDATVLLSFPVSWDANSGLKGRLVLRFDQHGNVYAALHRETPGPGTLDRE